MRLNKQLRETIIENALKASSIEAETNALSKRSYELSDRVRLDSLGGVEVETNMLTVEQLIKIWPEAKALIPTEKVPAPMPLSTNVASLNNLIGLPK